MTIQLLESMGFTINLEKSQLIPAQRTQFLGFILDSRLMKFFLPEEKDQSRVPDPPKPDKGDHPTAVPIVGQNGSSSASSPVSPTAILPVAVAQK